MTTPKTGVMAKSPFNNRTPYLNLRGGIAAGYFDTGQFISRVRTVAGSRVDVTAR
jgi:hypothetical protein